MFRIPVWSSGGWLISCMAWRLSIFRREMEKARGNCLMFHSRGGNHVVSIKEAKKVAI